MAGETAKRLTAKQVRELPEGTRVTIHGRNRRGEREWQIGTLTESGGKLDLIVLDYNGRTRIPVKDYKGRYYTAE